MLQILLTRIFSVTLWYHFAFMAVSIAMFGLTLGAVIVYLYPRTFAPELVKRQLAVSSFGFAASIAVCFLLHLFIPYLTGTGSIAPDPKYHGSHPFLATIAYLGLTYVVISVPFVFSGIAVCLALTRFPARVNRLDAADLAGAALGCAALPWLMRVADGPSAVIAVAALASIGALLFALDTSPRAGHMVAASLVAALLLGSSSAFLAARANHGEPLLRLLWVKGKRAPKPLFEKWNSFAYFRVGGNPNLASPPIGWGLSEKAVGQPLRQLAVNIDAAAGTVMTNFDGDLSKLRHLEFDVTNLAHHLRRNARVLVAGVGGGRDVLSALYFRQASVVGVEINGDLVKAVNGRFGEFTGHLDRQQGVAFVTDEARSFVARQRDSFDIIQVSLIDTWAATAAGAFVLSENALYTVEAWETFLEHLTPTGLLTFSRWHNPTQPGETYRLTALATGALLQLGVDDPRRHIVNVTNLAPGSDRKVGICTILTSRSPLSDEDLSRLRAKVEAMRFSVLVSPDSASDPILEEIVASRDLAAYARAFPLDISPPTDDRPFFFNMLRLRDALRVREAAVSSNDSNLRAVRVLGSLLAIVLVLSAAFLLIPLLWRGESVPTRAVPWLLYFGTIGLGFMFVEISLIQRLIGLSRASHPRPLGAPFLIAAFGRRWELPDAPDRGRGAGAAGSVAPRGAAGGTRDLRPGDTRRHRGVSR